MNSLTDDKIPFEMSMDINKRRYQYYELGSGESNIIFLHGLAGGNEAEPDFYDLLTNNNKCYFLDLPAHHGLPLYNMQSLDDLANYIIDFIDYFQLKNLKLVGFSLGGLISIQVALKLKTKGLIVPVVAWATPLNKSYTSSKAAMSTNMMSYSPSFLYKFLVTNNLSLKMFSSMGITLSLPDQVSLVQFDNKSTKMFNSCIPDKTIDTKDLPILFIFGTNDTFINADSFDKTQVQTGIQEKVLVENGGHFGTNEGRLNSLSKIEMFFSKQ